jgi:hypothetical protein
MLAFWTGKEKMDLFLLNGWCLVFASQEKADTFFFIQLYFPALIPVTWASCVIFAWQKNRISIST